MSLPTPAPQTLSATSERLGWWLGLLGVTIFAMTLPMTRLAVGDQSAPQLSPLFVVAGRAALAALLSLAFLLAVRAPRPRGSDWKMLALSGLGTVIGYPLFLGLALRRVDAMHAAVITGVLPLATALVAALVLRQRPSSGFWACAVGGCTLVILFAWQAGGGGLQWADLLLLCAVVSAAYGYVIGARLAAKSSAEQVICWVLVISLPLTAPVMLFTWPTQGVSTGAWVGFGYVTLFSMWLGFFAWYRGLALGGTMRVSQVQLLQPFLSMLFAVPVAGERLDAVTLLFALAVMATVLLGRKTPVRNLEKTA
jgi:drug/metabolite transporter (DMT)-like permease